jgi:hypothetical protein
MLNKMKIFSLVRPYSLANIIFIVLVTIALAKGQVNLVNPVETLIAIVAGLIFWVACVFLLEFFHKTFDAREDVFSTSYLLLPVALLVIIFAIKAPIAIVFFIFAVLFAKLYSMKVKGYFFSEYVFLCRPMAEILIIFSVCSMLGVDFLSVNILGFCLAVYFISLSRNIVGDIRDVDFDISTFPKIFGVDLSYALSIIFAIALLIVTGLNDEIIPIVIIILFLVLRVNAYGLHKIYILFSSFYFAILLVRIDPSMFMISTLVLMLSALLNFTYNITPRKSNVKKPDWA